MFETKYTELTLEMCLRLGSLIYRQGQWQVALKVNNYITIDKITIIQSDELDSYWKSVEYDWIKVDII
jgi:hypothetical protein